MPHPVPRIAHVLLDLPLLPARGRVAELGLKQVVAHHRGKPHVHLPCLARSNPVYRGFHIVVDAAAWHATEHRKGPVVRIKQHLVGLQRVGHQHKRTTVAQLELCDLQLGAHPTNHRPVLAPVKLEGLARTEQQRHKRATAHRL